MWNPEPNHPLRRTFAALAEHALFARLGVPDAGLADYLSELLARFTHHDAVYRLRGATGQPLTALADMVIEAEKLPAGGRARCDYYRHIGDFALFFTGLFPEAVARQRHSKDALVSYTAQGKRGYLLAGRMEEERHHDAEAELFHRLSARFEVCAVGLREVRAELAELREHPQGGIVS
jgi:hypothetical protein